MVKVLRVIARLNVGGPAIHTILLSSELNKGGRFSDVLVCGNVSESEGDMSYLAKEKGVKPVVVNSLGRDISFAKDIKAFLEIFSVIRRERPDIVHTHTAKAGALGRLAAIIAGVPVKVHTFHGHVFDGYFSPAKARAFISIEKVLGYFTDKVITVSERVKEDVIDRLKVVGAEKSAVIPLGLELDQFRGCEARKGELRKKLGLSADVLLVGIVGRLVPIKNHKMFLEVAAKVVGLKPDIDVRFLIVGDGELRVGLEEYAAKLGLKERVMFTGWAEDLPSVYSDLDIVAMTSLNEGTPVSIIEALAAGRAVVSTDVGGVGDLLTDGVNGALVKANDVEAFADKLLELMKDKTARAALGNRGREFVRQRYSKARLVKDVTELYEECLRKKNVKTGRSA
jgi:glycosyltransferase involved in cell wall biosynthesis